MPNDNIIQATGVHKTYDTGKVKVEALRGVDLSIQRGEMVAIMGPSGCGKTTLLNVLSGIDDVTAGQVIIDGTSIHHMSDKECTRYRAEKMGFVFQAINLLPVLSAVENVELPLLVAGVKLGEARRRALGFQKGMVQLSFLLESSFVALLGIAIGIALGAGLSVQIVDTMDEFFPGITYQVPWLNIAVVGIIAYGASLLTTYLPARQAARVYPAEALRYE